MRKTIIENHGSEAAEEVRRDWLDLDALTRVELSSEDTRHPIESALSGAAGGGWRARQPGEQTIRLRFDAPRRIRHIQLLFEEHQHARTQEFVLRWSPDGGESWREVVRQQYNFSPPGMTREREDYSVDLDGLTLLELNIVPDISGGETHASLAQLRLA